MAKSEDRYVVCVRTDGALDLEPNKLYLVMPDERAAADDYLRVVDESGEDYLYPASFFVPVVVPEESARALRAARRSSSGAAG